MNSSLTYAIICLVGFNMLPQISLRPMWATAFAFGLLGYRFWLERKNLPMPERRAKWMIQLLIVVFVWQQFHSLTSDDAPGTLLSLLVCVKTYELRSRRDYFLCCLLSVLVLMSYLLLNQSLAMTAYIFVDVLLIMAFLQALENGEAKLGDWRKMIWSSLKLIGKAVPLMVVAFLLFPRFTTPFGSNATSRGKTGLADELNPGSIAELIPSNEVIFRATFPNDEVPPGQFLYWRGSVLHNSGGLIWRRNKKLGRSAAPMPKGPLTQSIEIFMEPSSEVFLLALENTRTILFPNDPASSRLHIREGRVFEIERPLVARDRYLLESEDPGRELVTTETTDVGEYADESAYLQTPGKTSARLQQLLNKFSGLSDSEKVAALMNHFSAQNFEYSLNPPEVSSMDEFLFRTKIGFCEHFAGTMATLLRYLNVPARVVVGFQGGTKSFVGGFITVRGHDAHAWVEYFDRKGSRWRRIDPTTQVAPLRLSQGSDTYLDTEPETMTGWIAEDWERLYRRSRAYFDAVDAAWISFLLRFDWATQREILSRLQLEDLLVYVLGVFLLLGLILYAAILYYLEARKREKLSPDEALYRQLLKILKLWQIEKSPVEGPLVLFERIRSRSSRLAEAAQPILETLIHYRFGRGQLDHDSARRLRRQLRALRKLRPQS